METEKEVVQRLIDEQFGPELQRDALRHLHAAYREADRYARNFDPAQRRKVYGHARLAAIEQALKLLCKKHSGLRADDVRADGSNYEHFTMTSESLVITCSAVPAPNKLPRRAMFRQSLASGVNYSLFPEPKEEAGRSFFHILLLHSYERRFEFDLGTRTVRTIRRTDRPGFCELAVPTRDGLGRILTTNLFALHAETIDEIRGVVKEDVASKLPKRRRRDLDETSDGGTGE